MLVKLYRDEEGIIVIEAGDKYFKVIEREERCIFKTKITEDKKYHIDKLGYHVPMEFLENVSSNSYEIEDLREAISHL